MTTAETKRLTFEEWQALPETNQICEVVDGVLVMPPSPLGEHQWVSDEILVKLRPYLKEKDLGIAISAPYDVLISRTPLRVRQPDILVGNSDASITVATYGLGDVLRSVVIPEFELAIDDVFGPLLEPE